MFLMHNTILTLTTFKETFSNNVVYASFVSFIISIDPQGINTSSFCWKNIGQEKYRNGIYQPQQEIHKYNLSRKYSILGIRNPYNSYFWINPEWYAKYTNENPKRVKFNYDLYSLYNRKIGSEREGEREQ